MIEVLFLMTWMEFHKTEAFYLAMKVFVEMVVFERTVELPAMIDSFLGVAVLHKNSV